MATSKPNPETRILEAVIVSLGKQEAAHPFSLSEVSELSNVSERYLLAHYQNKEHLLALAGSVAYAKLSEEALTLAKQCPTLTEFFNRYLDFLLKEPALTFFTLNVGHGVPHIAPLKDDRISHRVKVIDDAGNILKNYGIEPAEDYLLLWSYVLRHLVYAAGYLLTDPTYDTLENRLRNEQIINEGLLAFSERKD